MPYNSSIYTIYIFWNCWYSWLSVNHLALCVLIVLFLFPLFSFSSFSVINWWFFFVIWCYFQNCLFTYKLYFKQLEYGLWNTSLLCYNLPSNNKSPLFKNIKKCTCIFHFSLSLCFHCHICPFHMHDEHQSTLLYFKQPIISKRDLNIRKTYLIFLTYLSFWHCLFFCIYSKFLFTIMFLLSEELLWISYNAGLLVINSLSSCSSGKVFMSSSFV